MNAAACRAARKARERLQYLAEIQHRIWRNEKALRGEQFSPRRGYVEPKSQAPWPDHNAMIARDRERELAQAEKELWPAGIGVGSGT